MQLADVPMQGFVGGLHATLANWQNLYLRGNSKEVHRHVAVRGTTGGGCVWGPQR